MTEEEDALVRVGEAVVERRLAMGLSQADLAKRANIDPKTLRSLEQGERWPRDISRTKIERALEWAPMSLDAILEGRPPKPPQDDFVWDPPETAASRLASDTEEDPEEQFAVDLYELALTLAIVNPADDLKLASEILDQSAAEAMRLAILAVALEDRRRAPADQPRRSTRGRGGDRERFQRLRNALVHGQPLFGLTDSGRPEPAASFLLYSYVDEKLVTSVHAALGQDAMRRGTVSIEEIDVALREAWQRLVPGPENESAKQISERLQRYVGTRGSNTSPVRAEGEPPSERLEYDIPDVPDYRVVRAMRDGHLTLWVEKVADDPSAPHTVSTSAAVRGVQEDHTLAASHRHKETEDGTPEG